MVGRTMLLQNLKRFRLITFDITETLIDFSRAPAVQYSKTAAQLGVHVIDRRKLEQCFKQEFKAIEEKHPNFGLHSPNFTWQDWWSQLVYNIFHCVDPNIEEAKLKELSEKLIKIYRTSECWRHMEGGLELIKCVRDADKKVGVISNFDPSLEEVLKEMNLLDKFDFVLTSYEAGYQKPHKNIFQKALDVYNVQPHEALHVGNTYEIDYVGARNAGWSSLLITPAEKDLQKAAPTQGYKNIADLLVALKSKEIRW
ncbi:rhythmically expressed gene 2 protein [Lucilia cuprina]|uniref:rhythmically expressed gene 2 protein n=1 Tax=Lucilia cuprina TaxID=7375 RepID=UPI000C71A6CC|nr:rhythmically expressed gene 2 protein [Lucilia cuprina]KAI8120305.1 Rhythmically expressed gene 2 protein [Lucilia cuprina]